MIYGEDILYNIIRFTDKDINLVQDFNCGNEVINDYLKETEIISLYIQPLK